MKTLVAGGVNSNCGSISSSMYGSSHTLNDLQCSTLLLCDAPSSLGKYQTMKWHMSRCRSFEYSYKFTLYILSDLSAVQRCYLSHRTTTPCVHCRKDRIQPSPLCLPKDEKFHHPRQWMGLCLLDTSAETTCKFNLLARGFSKEAMRTPVNEKGTLDIYSIYLHVWIASQQNTLHPVMQSDPSPPESDSAISTFPGGQWPLQKGPRTRTCENVKHQIMQLLPVPYQAPLTHQPKSNLNIRLRIQHFKWLCDLQFGGRKDGGQHKALCPCSQSPPIDINL